MANKAIVELLANAVKNKDNDALNAIATDLKLSRDHFDAVVAGTSEINAALAMKLEQVLGVEAIDILNAQSKDQLTQLGHQRVEKTKVAVERVKGTGTDGVPSQSPMPKDRGIVSMSFSGVSDAQANKAVRAVMQSFAE